VRFVPAGCWYCLRPRRLRQRLHLPTISEATLARELRGPAAGPERARVARVVVAAARVLAAAVVAAAVEAVVAAAEPLVVQATRTATGQEPVQVDPWRSSAVQRPSTLMIWM